MIQTFFDIWVLRKIMTIKIERDAVLYILSREPSTEPSPSSLLDDDDAEIVVYCSKEEAPVLIPPSSPRPSFDDDDFFQPSSPCSTLDLVDSDVGDWCSFHEPEKVRRRVTFCPHLVSEVWTRPRTRPQDLRKLFYTYEETQAFRQEYRREREILESEEHTHLPATSPNSTNHDTASTWQEGAGPAKRHRISRVVVHHHDTLETFFHTGDNATVKRETPALPAPSVMDKSDNFFDVDSFWSGSITWY